MQGSAGGWAVSDLERCALSPGVDLSAYRIVQEALTNTRRHAGASSARVRLRYRLGGVVD